MPIARRLVLVLVAAAAALALLPASGHAATDPCATPVTNPVACENSKPGNPPSDWDVTGIGDTSIQGYATKMSVNVGQSVSFKVDTSAAYHIDIYRLGYYDGDGARRIASNIATTPRNQPACLTVAATGLIDCGNWGVSASWTVPSTAVSGVYIALLIRNDTGGDSQIPFVVRDDSSHSDVVLQTSDATWQAYNAYGGNSLYSCTVQCPAGNQAASSSSPTTWRWGRGPFTRRRRCARSAPSPGVPPSSNHRAGPKMAAMARTRTGSSITTSSKWC